MVKFSLTEDRFDQRVYLLSFPKQSEQTRLRQIVISAKEAEVFERGLAAECQRNVVVDLKFMG